MQSQTDKLSSTFAALADPTRRAILARLSVGETTVQDIAKPFNMTLPAVSKHLKVLEKAKLISRGRSAQWRPCYLVAEPLKEASDWMEKYRRFWEESFDRLDEYLKEMQADDNDGEVVEQERKRISEINKTKRRTRKWQTKQK
ncbi:MAG: ArsR/SmtB family transcription factor [Pyrinomonadaceae bacterium]